ALGTTAELKESALHGTLVEILCDKPRDALTILQAAPGVREAALYGIALHALLAPGTQAESIEERLRTSGIAVTLMGPIRPTLEDVFISLIGADDRAAAG